jgi:polysaccharide export outer membrane protein
MTKDSRTETARLKSLAGGCGFVPRPRLIELVMLWCAVLLAVAGCQTQPPQPKDIGQQVSDPSQAISLREGDILKMSFPGAPNLNTTQQVRRDGKIALPLVGEIKAAGMAPAELEKEIIKLYSSQLVSKEVSVTVESSSFPVFVTGAVLRPGKVSSNRPITAIEAIMEAGGFDYAKANLKAVRVIRQEEGRVKNYSINLRLVLEGQQTELFYLKPSDIVYVPERFSWF